MRVVIPSVDYDDFLSITLPAWCKVFWPADITVVTTPGSPDASVARENGCKVAETDVWYRNGARFNEAAALDYTFQGTEPDDVCITIDADIYPVGYFPERTFEPNTVYGILRHQCYTASEFKDFVVGKRQLASYPITECHGKLKPGPCPSWHVLGYFQLFAGSHWLERGFGNYPTAAEYDMVFAASHNHGEFLSELQGLHLGYTIENWSGRKTERWD